MEGIIMGGARNTGGREGGRAGWNGRERQRPHRYYDTYWLEHTLHRLYRSVIDEPVPEWLLATVKRLPESGPSATGPAEEPDLLERARRWRAKAEEVRAAA